MGCCLDADRPLVQAAGMISRVAVAWTGAGMRRWTTCLMVLPSARGRAAIPARAEVANRRTEVSLVRRAILPLRLLSMGR